MQDGNGLRQWRPGCFASDGETLEIEGQRYRFANGEWWQWDGHHLLALGDAPAFLRSRPLPLPERHRTTGPVDFRGEH